MELNSRQIVALGAPLVVLYLTWSAVGSAPAAPAKAQSASAISPAVLAKRPVIAKLERDVFTRNGAFAAGNAASAPGEEGSSGTVHLTGTVVTARWRMAIIDGTRVFEGQTFRGFLVKTIGRDKVTLIDPEGQTVDLALDIAQPPPLPATTRARALGAGAASAAKGGAAGTTITGTAGGDRPGAGTPAASAAAERKSSTTNASVSSGNARPAGAAGAPGHSGESGKEQVQ